MQSTYGGMKKGFLFGGPSKKEKQTTKPEDDIPFIKPKETNENQYKFPEVQKAMSDTLTANKGN